MSPQATTTTPPLSPGRRRLVDLIRSVHFGRVENLPVRAGEPVFDGSPRVVHTLKVSGASHERRAAEREERLATAAISELLDQIGRASDGLIRRIEIAHGVPLFAELEESTTVWVEGD
jgi:hypothetical protein